jgi:LuxR family quorum-sensing system transcriptional regulator SinR
MLSLDDVDVRTLLRLEGDLTDQTLGEFLEFIRRRYDLARVAYQCPSFRGRSLADPFLILTESATWLDPYREFVGPVFEIGKHSVLPIDWARLPRTERNVQRLFGGATEADAGRQGLTIPVRGPTNSVWALFSVTSHDSDVEWSRRRHELMKDLVHVAHYVHQRAYEMHARDAPIDLNAITKREIEALEWSAEGKSPADIAILMRISVETVKAHLDSARFKLQALNRVHAVTKAIRAGLIQ